MIVNHQNVHLFYFRIEFYDLLYPVVPKIPVLAEGNWHPFLTEAYGHDRDCDRVRVSVPRDTRACKEGEQGSDKNSSLSGLSYLISAIMQGCTANTFEGLAHVMPCQCTACTFLDASRSPRKPYTASSLGNSSQQPKCVISVTSSHSHQQHPSSPSA
jgi:hypothetical protein